MVIGPSNCGKTTLVNFFNDYNGSLKKTQDIIYGKNTIDIPGAYIENTWMYKHVIALSQNASHILILIDQSRAIEVYSHGFGKLFKCTVIGVITKCDLNPENKERCLKQLKMIGVSEPYFHISFSNGTGIDDLKNYLFKNKSKGG
ncbi:EutP/PduV family microcompartment system protein [Clostridium sp. CTA-5]